MVFKIKTITAITFFLCMMNSCQQNKSLEVDNNDEIPSKYIVYTQYIINPQNGECYGYIDSILYWKKYQSDILLVYTSELTGENIYSPFRILIRQYHFMKIHTAPERIVAQYAYACRQDDLSQRPAV